MQIKEQSLSKAAFFVVLLLLTYFSYLVVRSLLSYLLFSIVLVLLFHPAYLWLVKKTNKPRLASTILVVLLILLLVIPTLWIGYSLVKQAPGAYESVVRAIDTGFLDTFTKQFLGTQKSMHEVFTESIQGFRQYALQSVPQFLSSATQIIVGLFIMFFTMFYLFTQGEHLLLRVKNIFPLEKKYTEKLLVSTNQVIHAVMEGQVLTGLAQGVVAGVTFWLLGLPNALFWGFLTAIFSMIPFVGSAVIWLPAGLWLLLQGLIWQGIVMLVVGVVVISQIDNVLRPFIVGSSAKIHPALVLIGVIGGLSAFGVIGFILGPLVLALWVAFLRVYKAEDA